MVSIFAPKLVTALPFLFKARHMQNCYKIGPTTSVIVKWLGKYISFSKDMLTCDTNLKKVCETEKCIHHINNNDKPIVKQELYIEQVKNICVEGKFRTKCVRQINSKIVMLILITCIRII